MDTVDGIDRGTAGLRGIAKRPGLRFATTRCIVAMRSSHCLAFTGTIVPLQEDPRPPLVRALVGTVCLRSTFESPASKDLQPRLSPERSQRFEICKPGDNAAGAIHPCKSDRRQRCNSANRGIADRVCWTRLQIRLRPFIQLRAIHSSGKEYAKRTLSRSTAVCPFCASSRNRRFAVIHAASPCSLDSCESKSRQSHDAILVYPGRERTERTAAMVKRQPREERCEPSPIWIERRWWASIRPLRVWPMHRARFGEWCQEV